ncbi:conserved exported protein of unknown function [Pseudodesulfovibrio profundus]|uniref:Uncharacterized protein n=1 Tax=Pseudodesulfovibrio profundus TaxID=57320 RepID=A0A2C8FBF2_9BACT|nr:transporter substrate-binding domain-containing protein [Pseudodesulfovibrio profundus]SOB59765.1 conserved exported protein of unknown function [Pseudodesulfovibrio profundus]
MLFYSMSRNAILIITAACAALLMSFSTGICGQSRRIVLATHDLNPYGYYHDSGKFDGDAVRVVRYALDKMGISLNLIVVPWERAQLMTWEGEADGFFAASKNEYRERHGVMSEIIADQKWTWYMLKSNPLDPSNDDFKENARVTSFIGANMLKWLKNNGYLVATPPKNTEALARMLQYQRFDAALANHRVMENIIHKHKLHGKFKSRTLQDKPLGVYFNRNYLARHPEFLEEFNHYVREYRTLNP